MESRDMASFGVALPPIPPEVLFGAAVGVALLLIVPLCVIVVVGVRRNGTAVEADALIHRSVAQGALEYVSGSDRSAGRTLRSHIDDPEHRTVALDALAAFIDSHQEQSWLIYRLVQDSSVGAWLARELGSNNTDNVARALEFAAEFRMQSAVAEVWVLLGHESADVRKAAHKALAVLDPDGALGALLRRTQAGEDWADCLIADVVAVVARHELPMAVLQRSPSAALAQGLAGGPVSETVQQQRIFTLLALLDSASDFVRLLAIRTLGSMNTPSAIAVLFGGLHSGVALVRTSCAAALAESSRGRVLLTNVANDPTSETNLLARSVLSAIDGEFVNVWTPDRPPRAPAHIDLRQRQTMEDSAHGAPRPSVAARSVLPEAI